MTIGVLALQGDFEKHIQHIQKLGETAIEVRKPSELAQCSGLIIPGGESTTLSKLMKNIGLDEAIIAFNQKYPILGTCAGAIMVSNEVTNHVVKPLDLLDISIERNAYGRQIDSFVDTLKLQTADDAKDMEGVFIRAPKITRIGKNVTPIAFHQKQVVCVESKMVIAATFHPELTDSLTLHHYFVDKIKQLS